MYTSNLTGTATPTPEAMARDESTTMLAVPITPGNQHEPVNADGVVPLASELPHELTDILVKYGCIEVTKERFGGGFINRVFPSDRHRRRFQPSLLYVEECAVEAGCCSQAQPAAEFLVRHEHRNGLELGRIVQSGTCSGGVFEMSEFQLGKENTVVGTSGQPSKHPKGGLQFQVTFPGNSDKYTVHCTTRAGKKIAELKTDNNVTIAVLTCPTTTQAGVVGKGVVLPEHSTYVEFSDVVSREMRPGVLHAALYANLAVFENAQG